LKTIKWLEWLVLLAMLGGVFFAVFRGYGAFTQEMYPLQYTAMVEKYAAENGLDPYFVYAVIRTESGFNPNACHENTNASGLMQLLPSTFAWLQSKTGETLAPGQIFDPETNIRYGTFYLGLHFQKYGSTELAAAAYHAGPGKVDEWLADGEYSNDGVSLQDIPFKDTRHYVGKINQAYEKYKKLYEK